MLMETGYFTYTQGVQRQCSIQGYPVNGIMIFTSQEAFEPDTFLTVRTPSGTLVERINLDTLHQISDYYGGNTNDDTFTGFVYVDLGLVSLGDSEEMNIVLDCESSHATAGNIGVAVIIDDLPENDELTYHYQQHTDTSFASEAVTSVFVFKGSISTSAELINVKQGEDTRSTTLRATNWFANLMGKIEDDNTTMGVVFDNTYGQPVVINMSATGVTTIMRRIVQVDDVRRKKATKRLARAVVRKYNSLDAQTKRAVT